MASKLEKTKESTWKAGKADYRLVVTYGFDFLRGNAAPYFHVTGDLWERRSGRGRWPIEPSACGQLHDHILKRFGKSMPSLIRWHLTDARGPMHYAANALYWWKKATGESDFKAEAYDPDPIEAFKSTIVFGALADDQEFDLTPGKGREAEIAGWLAVRLPRLLAQFRADVEAAGFVWAEVEALEPR